MKKVLGFWSKWMNHEEVFQTPAKYTPVIGLSKYTPVIGLSNTIAPREEPATINLHRAVLDEGPKIINKIERDIADMERRKIELLRQREIYIDLLFVAKKHATLLESKQ